jgi:aspartyl-tRNA(Asn)/glutamyl-tRNA(Gln) amidotransferase subunit B
MNSLIVAIGLEVHVELKMTSKLFCKCPVVNDPGNPNNASCHVCQGQPGVLPALNPDVVPLALRCAYALRCEVQDCSSFDRKHYFYADLPKNFQITQSDRPLGVKGSLSLTNSRGEQVNVRIRRIHIEEDAAKLEHRVIERRRVSLVDFNRCGVPLLEIVSEADIVDPQDARLYLEVLRSVVRWHGVSDAEMNKGQLRCDANISVRPEGTPLEKSVKWEIKNLNSIEGVVASLRRAAERQTDLLKNGKRLTQTTFHWDQFRRDIQPRREKEYSDDYFYFTEPDLMELRLSFADRECAMIATKSGPEEARRELNEAKIAPEHIEALMRERTIFDYWRSATEVYPQGAVSLAKLIANNVRACANVGAGKFEDYIVDLPAHRVAELASRIDQDQIIRNSDLDKLIDFLRTRPDLAVLSAASELALIPSSMELSEQQNVLRSLIESNPQKVAEYRNGKVGLIGFFVGEARRLLPGEKPGVLHDILLQMLQQ